MSYDLRIYSVKKFEPAMFDGTRGWNADHSAFQSANWQVVVNGSDRLLPEDVEEEIAAVLPGIGFLTELNLEGKPTEEAKRRLRSAAKAIAKATHGVIEDPQEDTFETPQGVSRFAPPPKEKSFSIVELSWWLLNDVLLDRAGRESFFQLLERWLPEAMPKRYGLWEPPQFIYAETGREHFHNFYEENLHDPIIWYPHRPVTGVHLGLPRPLGAGLQGFRTNCVEIGFELAALKQPGWAQGLQRFWREMSKLLRPIYGEVRQKGGYICSGGTIYIAFDPSNQQSEELLTRAWFWRGIPPRLGCAVVLGEQYQQLWPQFVAKAEVSDGLAFASVADWTSDRDLTGDVGAAPGPLTLLRGTGMGPTQAYPQQWPFGPVFSSPNR